ncbi:FYVE zinc finger domain-containing protein [Phytophthora infestans]|uniref:sn-1-specific diacylglycerol lipase n=1 Tax=Phytophthora infestans TaxID=4787 RepID=A0A833S532_PHYIN|nr:FYVE zinc finger domain-containing protein [Phytophthora infestans]KAF4147579.1 FYVE zinc finger domain-containing protein [Phytophthora infestans]
MPEVIENQRWYPIVGWSARLYAEDPPAWSTTNQEACSSTDEQKEFVWTVYKGEDYDDEGWLYGEKFNDTLGPMTRSSAVRTRVWMGNKQDEQKEAESASSKTENATSGGEEASKTGEWQTLFPSDKKEEENADESKEDAKSASTEVKKREDHVSTASSAKEADEKDNVLFPPPDGEDSKRNTSAKRSEPARSSGFFGRFSSAVVSLPSSAINLAGSSSKQAVYGTVQSIREASLFGLEMAQAATAAAISAEPQTLPTRKGHKNGTKSLDEDDTEVLSMLSKRFPDLSPVERSLVTCCQDSIPKYLSPPELTESKQCKECDVEFGMTKFRYQCGYCSESFCRDHLPESAIIRAYGHTTPSKLCKNCHYILMEKIDQQLVQWRIERVKDYLDDKLIVYYNTATDTAVDKIMRAAGGTLVAAKSAPIGAAAKMAVVSADFLRKYGRAGLIGFILRNEFMQSFSTLKGLLGDLDDLGFQDAAIGTYYFMAMNRGDRGAEPEGEKTSHNGCEPVSDEFLTKVLKYAPLALHGIYELDVLDIQRISRLQGFSLIYAHVQDQDVRHPSFALLGSKETKTALVLIRGSKSVQDALTDIQACPEEIGLSSPGAPQSEATGGFVDAFAHNGMLKAVMWIKDRIVKSLRVLHNEGYHIVFAGHSLGAGCAALLSVMLQKEFVDLECFAYAVPACVNLGVAESCDTFVHSIVLRDDIVPRAKASNVMKLVEELKNFKGCWRGTASEDLEAFKDRAKTLWAPRKREWATEAADQRKGKLANRDKAISPTDKPTLAEKKAKDDDKDEGVSSWTLTRTNLIDQLDKAGDKSSEDEQLEPSDKARQEEKKVAAELVTTLVDDPKELYIPGKVTHIFFYKGIYEAVHVDRKCEELSHIPVQQNMLSDHLGCNYLSALRIVRDARRAKPALPEWVPFSTKTRCMCCDSPFTWNSTSSSEAQQNRDQHNCRRCGALVCEGCSQKFKSIPEFGINVPVRVCDRCYYEA